MSRNLIQKVFLLDLGHIVALSYIRSNTYCLETFSNREFDFRQDNGLLSCKAKREDLLTLQLNSNFLGFTEPNTHPEPHTFFFTEIIGIDIIVFYVVCFGCFFDFFTVH